MIKGDLLSLKSLQNYYKDQLDDIYNILSKEKLSEEIINDNITLKLIYYENKCKQYELEIKELKLRPIPGEDYLKALEEFNE